MKTRVVLTIACWTIAAILVVPLGTDSMMITATGATLSGLFMVMGLRRSDSNELTLAAIFLAATYGRAVMFAEGTDDFAPVVAVALVAYLIAASGISDGRIDAHDGYWQARLRLGGLWLGVATGIAAATAAAASIESSEPRLVWLVGLAATIVLLALIAATDRSQNPSP
jgi:hypothetical protein